MSDLVVLRLDELRIGLPVASVERIVGAVAVTPLPKAPDIVIGVVNFRGQIVPVVDIRKRFHLPDREVALTDRLVIARTTRRRIGVFADAVTDVTRFPDEEIVGAEGIVPGIEYVDGVVKLGDGLILIHDLDRFLSLEEDRRLGQALGVQ